MNLRDAAEKAWVAMVAIERDVWWGETSPTRIALREAIEALDAALDADWEAQGQTVAKPSLEVQT